MELFMARPWSAALIVAVTIAAGLALSFIHRRTLTALPLRLAVAMAVLRALTVGLLAIILARPVLTMERSVKTRPVVAVLLDSSLSMGLKDAPDEEETRTKKLSHTIIQTRFLRELGDKARIQAYEFSSHLARLKQSDLGEPGEPHGQDTDVAAALKELAQELKGSDAEAAVLLSDGCHNGPGDPLAVLPSLALPVFTVGIGRSVAEASVDSEIVNVAAPEKAVVGQATEVSVTAEVRGVSEGFLELNLSRDGRNVASAKVPVPTDGTAQVARLALAPEEAGRLIYRLELKPFKGETDLANNEKTIAIRVSDPTVRVVYLEGTPRWEYKFIRRALRSDAKIGLTAFLQTREDKLLRQGPEGAPVARQTGDEEGSWLEPGDLAGADVIILGDIAPAFFDKDQLQELTRWVERGGGFLMLGGDKTFGQNGYAGTVIAEMLPAGIDDTGELREQFKLEAPPAAREHPVVEGMSVEILEKLPTLESRNILGDLKPGGTALFVKGGLESAELAPAVLAVQNYGKGRTAVLATSSTWRWAMENQDGAKVHTRFWRQLIVWLARGDREKAGPGVELVAERDEYMVKDIINLVAKVSGEGGMPAEGAAIACNVRVPDGAERSVTMKEERPGTYTGTFSPPLRGTYRFRTEATKDSRGLGSASLELVVSDPSREYLATVLNDKLLREIAAKSGGSYFHLDELDKLPDSIPVAEKVVTRTVEKRPSEQLWFFLALLGTLVAEWIIRRKKELV